MTTRRVRSDVIIRRFLDGWTFAELIERLGTDLQTIERAIRNALNRKKAR